MTQLCYFIVLIIIVSLHHNYEINKNIMHKEYNN